MTEKTGRRRLQGETGSALLASFMLITLITGAGLSAMTASSVNQNKATNVVGSKQALYLAEAALNHGKMYLHQNIANWNTYAAYTTAQTLIPSTAFAGIGSYTVTIKAANNNALLMTATGTATSSNAASLADGSKSISTLLTLDNGNLLGNAFITGKDLLVSGNPALSGTSGGIHVNGNLTISGNPTITTNAEASGTYTVTGHPTAAFSGGGQPQQTINSLTPSQLSGSRDYYFTFVPVNNATYGPHYHGQVYDKFGNKLEELHDGETWGCWKYKTYKTTWDSTLWANVITPFTWTATGTCTPTNGTYYVIGDVVLAGTIGSVGSPWKTTILAYGSIQVTSPSLVVRPPTSADGSLYKTSTQNLLFVASKDILITGNASQKFGYVDPNTQITYGGIMSAYEQVGISGNPSVYGYVLAQDVSNEATSPYGTNAVDSNYISGNMQLVYNGLLATGSQGNAVPQATLY